MQERLFRLEPIKHTMTEDSCCTCDQWSATGQTLSGTSIIRMVAHVLHQLARTTIMWHTQQT
jgi:hypothetical protein